METNEFESARTVLEARALADQRLREEWLTKCDWDMPDDVLAYRAGLRHAARRLRLDRSVKDRRCPNCGLLKPLSSQWVVSSNGLATCRSCYQRVTGTVVTVKLGGQMFMGKMVRVRVAPSVLRDTRNVTCLSRREFARRCGWSAQYQLKLEKGEMKSISLEKAQLILRVLGECGVFFTDKCVGYNSSVTAGEAGG